MSAEEYSAYYYVDSANGADSNDGLTPASAVKTFSSACRKGAKADDTVAIVIMNEYSLSSGINEPIAHENLFVITTKDKTTDYSKDGAKIVLGKSKQFNIAGPTKFENITFDFTSSITFVANYFPLSFGEGMMFNKLTDEGKGVYVYGGWRQPNEEDTDIKQDSHLSFESGNYYLVVAGSKDRGKNADGKTAAHNIFEGTHYLDIKGGSFDIVYGGSHSAHASHSAVITMTGGTVGKFGVSGDASRRLNGDAVATFGGGEITELQVRNIIGEAHITLTGTKVGTLDLSCYNEEVRKMEEDANKKKTLYYDANFYTAEEIAAFGENFDIVKNVTTVYASASGKGSGTSESDAASFKDAFAKAAASDGTVIVIDNIALTDFAEPAHSGKVTVSGKNDSIKLTLSGGYTLGGVTEFSGITLDGNAEINSVNGTFTVASDAKVASEFNISGSAALYSGSYGEITEAKNVLIDGATVGTVVGGDALNIEVNSGKVAELTTAKSTAENVTVSVSGGEIEKLNFCGVTDSLTLIYLGGKITATTVENITAKCALSLGDGITKESLGNAASLFTDTAERVVYVKDGATGSGMSAASPTSPEEGVKLLNNGGTMVIVGEFTSSTATFTQAAAYTGKVKITSLYDGVDYRKDGARIVLKLSFHLGGDTVIDNVSIVSQGNNAAIFCGYNDVTFGTDIIGSFEGEVTTYPCIVTGTKADSTNVTSNVVINGGTWQRLRLGNSGGNPSGVVSNVTVNGGEFYGYIYLSSASAAGRTHNGEANLTVNAGMFYAGILGVESTSADAKYNVNINIELNGGRVYNLIRAQGLKTTATVTGNFVVKLYGGDFSHITDIQGPSQNGYSGKLNVGDNIDLDATLTGTYQFTNYLQSAADPWVFFHDGAYYMTKTGGREIRLWKSANLGDLAHGVSTVIYAPPSGYDFSKDLWSPEIHYLTDAEAGGEGLGGWYLFIGGQSETVTNFSGIRAFVLNAKDPDNLQGEWVNPVTGEDGKKTGHIKFQNTNYLTINGGTLVIVGEVKSSAAFYQAPAHSGKVIITSLYDGVDYRKEGARIVLPRSFYLGGDTDIDHVKIVSQGENAAFFCFYHDVTFGNDIEGVYEGNSTTYPCIVTGAKGDISDASGTVTVNGGDWQRLRLGNSGGNPQNVRTDVIVNGGDFHGYVYMISTSHKTHTGTGSLTVNGGNFYSGILGAYYSNSATVFDGDLTLTVNGGTVYNVIHATNKANGVLSGSFTLVLQGGNFSHLTDITGIGNDKFTCKLQTSEAIDLNAKLSGTYDYTNNLRGGADPFLFYHDGCYYYTSTVGSAVRLYKAANFGDFRHGISTVIYDPEDDKEWGKNLWAPELHYYSEEEVGAANAGWYLYVGGSNSESEDASMASGQRLYVLKCLTDDLQGAWGHPITGEVNVPAKLEFPGTNYNTTQTTADASVIRIGSKPYLAFFTTYRVAETNGAPYQAIVLAEVENPWTFPGAKEICHPEHEWEKGGSNATYPMVVEGPSAIYAPDGTTYIGYSGSGYWTVKYCLGALRYIGGNPTEKSSWEKLPEPFLSKSTEIVSCGHASYFTSPDGKMWVCYHGRYGDATSDRYTFVEPMTADKNGISVGNGSGTPASVDTVWTVNVNPQPITDKLSGFDTRETVASTATVVKLTIGSKTAYINGKAETLDAAPINRNNRTMLPVRFLANAFGVTNDGIKWDASTRTATLSNATTTIVVTIDAPSMTVNGKTVTLDSPAIIENNRTYLPVRAIANTLGVSNENISWDGATNTATLVK